MSGKFTPEFLKDFAAALVKVGLDKLALQKSQADKLAKEAAAKVEFEQRTQTTPVAAAFTRKVPNVPQLDGSVLDLSVFNPAGKAQEPRKFDPKRALNP
jgi:hypothetical protein